MRVRRIGLDGRKSITRLPRRGALGRVIVSPPPGDPSDGTMPRVAGDGRVLDGGLEVRSEDGAGDVGRIQASVTLHDVLPGLVRPAPLTLSVASQ